MVGGHLFSYENTVTSLIFLLPCFVEIRVFNANSVGPE